MKSATISLPEKRILQEEIKLLANNVASSLVPAILMALLLMWSQSNGQNSLPVIVWGLAVIAVKTAAVMHARYNLSHGVENRNLSRLLMELFALAAASGLSWGSMAWVAMDTHSVVSSVLVVSVIAGVGANGMSLYSTVYPVFMTFVITDFAPLEYMLWVSGGMAFLPLILCIAVYVILLVMYAKNNSTAARAAIDLRFENVDLIERLRVETLKAEQANLSKSKFLAAASHDLRQPIHALGLYLDSLGRSNLTQEQRETLGKAEIVSDATSEILNALLDFSRIEADVITPQIHSFQLQPLLNKMESELAAQADAKSLFYRTRETRLAVRTDPALLKLMLRNLVLNAIRYTRKGGILVACRKRGKNVLLEVWDTGIGIQASQQEEIFREFHQLGNPERDRRMGLGLGLAIVDRLARQLGLQIQLSSVFGRGSVFRILIPLAHESTAISDFETSKLTIREFKANVIFIDDEEAVRDGMAQLLHSWGCTCVAAESIEEAVSAARDFTPDIVICDYRLRENRTGSEAIATLRGIFGAGLPAILVTGDTAPERLREAIASGIPLLHKPVSAAKLNKCIVDLLARSKQATASSSLMSAHPSQTTGAMQTPE